MSTCSVVTKDQKHFLVTRQFFCYSLEACLTHVYWALKFGIETTSMNLMSFLNS